MSLLLFTDRRQASRPLPDVVSAAVAGGARLVVLRERDLPGERRLSLANRLETVLSGAGGTLAVAGPLPGWTGAVHLSTVDALPDGSGPPLVGRSCHDDAELAAAAAEGAHYATVSPVFPTASKPGYGPPLGLAGLARLCSAARLPVYALGGVRARDDVTACREAGAAGVAVMGAVMRAEDPAAAIKELLW